MSPTPTLPRSRRALLRLLPGLLASALALPVAAQTISRDPAAAIEEPAAVTAPFTVAQLTRKLETHFLEIETGQGSLLSSDGLTSDLLPTTNRTTVLETLGPPEAVRRFAFSYSPADAVERQQSRHWAGMIITNALPHWREGKRWVRRALVQAEKQAGPEVITETAEGYWISVSNPHGRAILEVSLLEAIDTDIDSLGVALTQLLEGLEQAFPKREQGMGTLFNGPGSISDRFFSDNAHATLETLGAADDLVGVRYLYELRDDDHPQATRDNRSYAFALVRNVFPDWAEAEDWLRAAIEESESKADRMAEATVIDRGGICLQVRYFVGAAASIDIMIHPWNTQI